MRFSNRIIYYLIALTIFPAVTIITANASPFPALEVDVTQGKLDPEFRFLAPNEYYPIRMKSLTTYAPQGGYLGVGTERTWTAIALNPQITFAILVDKSPEAVFYNQINLELIRVSKDRSHYLKLRFGGNRDHWQQAVGDLSPIPNPQNILLKKETFEWWEKARQNKEFEFFHKADHPYELFKKANYLFDDSLFDSIKKLVLDDKIQVSLIDLSKNEQINKLIEPIQEKGLKLSLVDISNAWGFSYIDIGKEFKNLILGLSTVSAPKALLLGTDVSSLPIYNDSCELQYCKKPFTYFAVRFENIISNLDLNSLRDLFSFYSEFSPPYFEIENLDRHLVLKSYFQSGNASTGILNEKIEMGYFTSRPEFIDYFKIVYSLKSYKAKSKLICSALEHHEPIDPIQLTELFSFSSLNRFTVRFYQSCLGYRMRVTRALNNSLKREHADPALRRETRNLILSEISRDDHFMELGPLEILIEDSFKLDQEIVEAFKNEQNRRTEISHKLN
jgi:hypothetical protein